MYVARLVYSASSRCPLAVATGVNSHHYYIPSTALAPAGALQDGAHVEVGGLQPRHARAVTVTVNVGDRLVLGGGMRSMATHEAEVMMETLPELGVNHNRKHRSDL